MEASALHRQAALPALAGRSPLLRLQSDEKLVALTRRGQQPAFEALVQRYQARLLAFCRHMLNSQEDAEDVLQEVFAASYNALLADDRPINARPWLYRIARNRCLNHLRKPKAAGQDSMDIFERDNGTTTAETVHQREEFRQIVSDVSELPETQRTALLLREIDALSYDQIAETMDTTVPSVKSLLVRARVSLAEASESRLLTCEEVRDELGAVAEGITRSSAPVRRHVRQCERCSTFKGELKSTSKALAAVYPIGPLIFLKKLGLAKLGLGGGAAASSAAAGGSSIAGGAGASFAATGAAAGGSSIAGGMVSAGVSTIASKAAAGMAAAVIVTGAAVEVKTVQHRDAAPATAVAQAPAQPAPITRPAPAAASTKGKDKPVLPKKTEVAAKTPASVAPVAKPEPVAVAPVTPPPADDAIQEDGSTVTLPPTTVPVAPPATGTTPPPPPAYEPPVVTPPAPATPPATPAPAKPAPAPAPLLP